MAKKSTEYDISKSGPRSYRDLQAMNHALARQSSLPDYVPQLKSHHDYIYEGPEKSPLMLQGNGDYWGNSMFDEQSATMEQFEDLNEVRAENQPWYSKLGAGIAKGLGNAATSFLSGTVGLAYGAVDAANGGSFWDNDFNKAMEEINQAMEEYLPNYYTRDELNNPLAWRNIFSANTLGDKLIKNLGFSVGMLYSGGVYTGLLKATRLPKLLTKLTGSAKLARATTSLVASTATAAGEANLESYRGAAEQVKAQTQMVEMEYDDHVTNLLAAYEDSIKSGDQMAIAELNAKITELESQKNQALATIKENGRKAGDDIWLGNMAVLMPSNLIQFGKLFSRGLSGVRNTYKITGSMGKYAGGTNKGDLLWGIGKGAITEGMEEISQGAITRGAANYYEQDLYKYDYTQAFLDPKAQKETKGIMSEIASSLVESFHTDQGKEEFLLGAVTGALGIPMIGRRSSGKLGLKLEGGIFNEIADYRRQKAGEEFIADQMNKRYNDPKFKSYYEGLVRHNYFSNIMKDPTLSTEDYKQAEDAQLVSDIIMFDQAGKLGDLEAMVKFQSENLTDENLDEIIRSTSTVDESTGEVIDGSFVVTNSSGEKIPLNSDDQGKELMRSAIQKQAEVILNAINSYRKVATNLAVDTEGKLNDSQLAELTFMGVQNNVLQDKIDDYLLDIAYAISKDRDKQDSAASLLEEQSSISMTVPFKNNKHKVDALKQIEKNNPGILDRLQTESLDYNLYSGEDIYNLFKLQDRLDSNKKTFEDYVNNPQKLEDKQKKQKKKTEQQAKKEKKQEAVKNVQDIPVGELATNPEYQEDINTILNDNSQDIEFVGQDLEFEGLEEETDKKDLQSKMEEVNKINNIVRSALQILDNGINSNKIDPLTGGAIKNAIQRAASSIQNNAQEMLDRSNFNYNDEQALVQYVRNNYEGFDEMPEDQQFSIIAPLRHEVSQALDSFVEAMKRNYDKMEQMPSTPTHQEPQESSDEDPTDDHPSHEKPLNKATIFNVVKLPENDGTGKYTVENEHDIFAFPDNAQYVESVGEQYKQEDILGLKSINYNTNTAIAVVKQENKHKQAIIKIERKQYKGVKAEESLPSEADMTNLQEPQAKNSTLKGSLRFATPRVALKSPFGDTTPWHSILVTIKKAQEKLSNGEELTAKESQYLDFYKDELNDPNSYINKQLNDNYIERIAHLYEYLDNKGAFDAVDSGQVQVGDKLVLVVDPSLNARLNNPQVLFAKIDNAGNPIIVGDVSTWNKDITSMVMSQYNSNHQEGDNSIFISGYEVTVNGNYVGRIPFSDREDTVTLNDIFKGAPNVKLGIVSNSSGSIQSTNTDIKSESIRLGKNMKKGQPVLLLETSDKKLGSRRAWIPVPFMMAPYSAETANTTLGSWIEAAVDSIVDSTNSILISADSFVEAKNQLLNALYIPRDKCWISVEGNSVVIRADKQQIKAVIDENLKENLLKGLQEKNIPFQIDSKLINDVTEEGDNYNEIIGEIARVNLHPGYGHTISDFFTTTVPLKEDTKKIKENKNDSSNSGSNRVSNKTKKGEVWTVDTETWNVYNNEGKLLEDPHHTDPTCNAHRAKAFCTIQNAKEGSIVETPWGNFDQSTGNFIIQKKGQNEINEIWSKFEQNLKEGDPINILNSINEILDRVESSNDANSDEDVAQFSQQQYEKAVEEYNNLKSQGYDIENRYGLILSDDKIVIKEVIESEHLPLGSSRVAKRHTPTIKLNGEIIQTGVVSVYKSPYKNIEEYYNKYKKLPITSIGVMSIQDDEYYSYNEDYSVFSVPIGNRYVKFITGPMQESTIKAIREALVPEVSKVDNVLNAGDDYWTSVIEGKLLKYLSRSESTQNIVNTEDTIDKESASEDIPQNNSAEIEQKKEQIAKKIKRQNHLKPVLDALSNEQLSKMPENVSKAKGLLEILSQYFDTESNTFTDENAVQNILDNAKYKQQQEYEKPSKESQIKKEVRWFKRTFPNLHRSECLTIVENMIDINNSKMKAWGSFKNGIIQIFKNASMGTVYHEAFHAVVNMLMSSQERKQMFDAARAKYQDISSEEVLEEIIAEDFRKYIQKFQNPILRPLIKLYDRLRIRAKELRNKPTYLDSLFYRINNGDYGSRNIINDGNVTRNNAVEEYKQAMIELEYAKKEPSRVRELYKKASSELKTLGTKLNILSKTRFLTPGDARKEIPQQYLEVLDVFEDRGRYCIDLKRERNIKSYLRQIDNIIKSIENIITAKEVSLQEAISEEALSEQEEKFRVAKLLNTNEQNVKEDIIKDTKSFLRNFNITLQDISGYNNMNSMFDALNRVIYYKKDSDITAQVGYAMAFMMQHDPTVKTLVWRQSPLFRMLFKATSIIKNKKAKNKAREFLYRKLPVKNNILQQIGTSITKELNDIYKIKGFQDSTEDTTTIINNFFERFSSKSREQYQKIQAFSRNVANSIYLNDPTVVVPSLEKPGTDTKATRVVIEDALLENAYEDSIIYALGQQGFALAGSASMALQGTLFRPVENPLHDIDFSAKGKNASEVRQAVNSISANNTLIRIIKNPSGPTLTYLVLDRPFIIKRPVRGVSAYTIEDPSTGKKLGSYVGSELTLNKGVQGKFLDFFLGDHEFPHVNRTMNGKQYLIQDARRAVQAKIEWQRDKDIWDYNRFVTQELHDILDLEQSLSDTELSDRIQNSNIIWGHPAIGKTTYLETRNDIIEWDKEVNPKRNEFIRQQIDPNNELDSKTFNAKKQEYMKNHDSDITYQRFLKREWEALKRKAARENKKIFASPLPLLKMFPQDFDLVINLNHRTFLKNNMNRGGKYNSTLDWKYAINEVMRAIPRDKVFNTEKYMSELVPNGMSPIQQYQNSKYNYDNLSTSDKEYLEKRGISKEEYESWSTKEKEIAMKCKL